MRRRDFISLSGAAALPPPVKRSEPTGEKVGWFFGATPILISPVISPVANSFTHGLHDLGRIEGRDFVLDRVPVERKYERIGGPATEPGSRNHGVLVIGADNKLAQAMMIGDLP